MSGDRPVIWVLEGQKAGDNAQAHELAARVGGRIETRRLRYNWLCKLPNFLLAGSLASLDRPSSDALAAPWPDLVIGVGRRSVPVACWIRKQSGGARLVQLGRPRARLDLFDLVITTPQYGLPAAPNVIELILPITPQPAVSDEEDGWRKTLAALPEPRIAVLVGGPMKPLAMGPTEIARLAGVTSALAQKLGASLVVIGSPRTPSGTVESMAALLGVPHRIFPWKAGEPNPYRATLRMAERFVVTSDSVSMLAEALGTGKPVDIFRLPSRPHFRLPLGRWPLRALVRAGIISARRDVDALVDSLIAAGHVGVLGENEPRKPLARNDDHAIARIRALLHSPAR